MNIFLVRHGQTNDNRDHLHSHPERSVLTDLGIQQAEKTAKRMLCEDIDEYIISTTTRTRQTAKPIFMQTSADISFNANIQEIIFGKYAGTPSETLIKDQETSGVDYYDFVPEGGESRNQFKKRVIDEFHKILEGKKGKNICLICHGGVIRVLLGHVFTNPYNDETYRSNNCSVSLIKVTNEGPELIYANNTDHLSPEDMGETHQE